MHASAQAGFFTGSWLGGNGRSPSKRIRISPNGWHCISKSKRSMLATQVLKMPLPAVSAPVRAVKRGFFSSFADEGLISARDGARLVTCFEPLVRPSHLKSVSGGSLSLPGATAMVTPSISGDRYLARQLSMPLTFSASFAVWTCVNPVNYPGGR